MSNYQKDSFEMQFEDTAGLISCSGRFGCSYGSVLDLSGHLWQVGIKGYCGEHYDEVGIYVKYSLYNVSYCNVDIIVEETAFHRKMPIPKHCFYPGQESFAILCKVVSIPQRLKATIHIEMMVETRRPKPQPELVNHHSTLTSFLQFDDGFHDCQIVVGTKTFKAHTCVLAAHSPVLLLQLLDRETVEVVAGFSVEMFQLFVSFLYHGHIAPADLEVYLCPLIELAAIYRVQSLLEYLLAQLPEFISAGQVMNVMNVANKYHLGDIGAITREFYVNNCKSKN